MKDKKSFARKIGDFLSGKGFYVVLFICTAVIGVSAWILLTAGNTFGGTTPDASGPDQAVMQTGSGATDDSEALGLRPSPSGQIRPSASSVPSASPSASPKTNSGSNSNKASAEQSGSSSEVMAKSVTFAWPLVGDIQTVYSEDELIYSQTMSDWRTHDGIDIAGTLGAKVMAAADGTVTQVYADDLLGMTVVIEHAGGLTSTYSNLAKTPVVKVGDKVAMGSVIGSVGETAIGETSMPTHLHFSIKQDGLPVDPSNYLPKK